MSDSKPITKQDVDDLKKALSAPLPEGARLLTNEEYEELENALKDGYKNFDNNLKEFVKRKLNK